MMLESPVHDPVHDPQTMVRFLIPSLFASLLVVVLARAQATSAPATAPTTASIGSSAAFERRLAAIDERASKVRDLVADFAQEKRSTVLRKPLVSRGAVRSKGGLSLWETTEPEP